MALAAVAYAKAMRGRRIMIATSSVGPGSTNMVTAAAVAHANRLPVLLLSGRHLPAPDRRPRPPAGRALRRPDDHRGRHVQAGEPLLGPHHASRPRSCGRFRRRWRRCSIRRPAARRSSRSPRTSRPRRTTSRRGSSSRRVHYIRRPGPDPRDVERRRDRHRPAPSGRCSSPVVASTTRAHVDTVRAFAERHGIPVVETVAGKSTLTHDHPNYAGPIGVTGSRAANAVAEQADVVIAVGTRLQDFTTGSWSVFRDPDVRFVGDQHGVVGCPQAGRPGGHRRREGHARGDRRRRSATTRRHPSGWRWPTSGSPNGTPISTRGRVGGTTARRPTPR